MMNCVESTLRFETTRKSHLPFEPKQDWNRAILDSAGREMFSRKAKADRFAWEAAELLAKGKHADASTLALQGIALIGQEHFASSCKRYAISLFQVPPNAASEFLKGLSPPEKTPI